MDASYAKTGMNITEDIQINQQAQNIQAVKLYDYEKFFLIEPNFKTTKISTKLLIDKVSGRIIEIDFHENPGILSDKFLEVKKPFSAFLGIITILDKPFLLFAHEVFTVCELEGSDIFQISTISFIPFEKNPEFYQTVKGKQIVNYIQNLKKLFSFGHYFSFTKDMTLSKDKQQKGEDVDIKFCWNTYLMKELISQKIDRKWTISLIQGFVSNFTVYLMGKKLQYFLVSRRSSKNAGTRYNSRGVDDDGMVANFVETEQIICYANFVCSHLMIRGSVPIFFEQRGVTANTKLTRSYEFTNPSFVKHVEILTKDYWRCIIINLLSKLKAHEHILTESLEGHIQKNNFENIRYEYFDYKEACKGQKFENVNVLVKKLEEMVTNFQFYAENRKSKEVHITQKGVFRINCLDCMDRTNIVMTKLAASMFEIIMKHVNIDLNIIFGDNLLNIMDITNTKKIHPLVVFFKNIWADNGDYISKLYSGTASTNTKLARPGKGGFLGLWEGGMRSLERFYMGNFEDHLKQTAIDMVLGEHIKTVDFFGKNIETDLTMRENEFISQENVAIFICTWNVGGFEVKSKLDLMNMDLFNFEGMHNPDIFVFGFQEVVNLGAAQVISTNNEKKIQLWTSILEENLKRVGGDYFLIEHTSLMGCFLIVYASEKIKDRISKVSTDTVKCGLMGKVGNKGATILKLDIDDTSIAFTNCHLEAGPKNNKSRVANINDIHSKAFQKEGYSGKKKEDPLESYEYKFLFGDLNFRVAMPNSDVRAKLQEYDKLKAAGNKNKAGDVLKSLLSYDQMIEAKKCCEYLDKYQEAPIDFLPTYKYDSFSNTYDTSSKQRTPSWCDRIMIWSNESCIIKQYFYNRREIKFSDHRPVTGYYVIETKKIDVGKKEDIIKEIYEKMDHAAVKENEEELKNLMMKNMQNE